MYRATKKPTIKIAIADDHAPFKAGVKMALSVYKDIEIVLEAENGSDLLMQLKTLQPNVILLDLQMEVMDGITALPLIKKSYPYIKVIILSMHNDISVITRLLDMGAHSYLAKTDEPYHMYNQIAACFQNEEALQ